MTQRQTACKHLLLVLALLMLPGCASIARAPFTKEQQAVATVPGIPNARVWSDDRADALLARARSEILADRSRTVNVLAISGGGSNGAYGAGLLAGWTERGEQARIQGRDRRQCRRADRAIRVPRSVV